MADYPSSLFDFANAYLKAIDEDTVNDNLVNELDKVPCFEHTFYCWNFSVSSSNFPFLYKGNVVKEIIPRLLDLSSKRLFGSQIVFNPKEVKYKEELESLVDMSQLYLVFPESFRDNLGEKDKLEVIFEKHETAKYHFGYDWESVHVADGVSLIEERRIEELFSTKDLNKRDAEDKFMESPDKFTLELAILYYDFFLQIFLIVLIKVCLEYYQMELF